MTGQAPAAPHRDAAGPRSASLRERKKLKMRQAMIDVSQRLFAAQGYAATTLDQIADELDTRPQTILRYFESKAHLALVIMLDNLHGFRQQLEDPDRAETTLELWRKEIVLRAGSVDGRPVVETFFDWVLREPMLIALVADINNQYEEALAAALAHDAGVDPHDDLHSHMVAAVLLGGNSALLRMWLNGTATTNDLAANQLKVVDWVEAEFSRHRSGSLAAVVDL